MNGKIYTCIFRFFAEYQTGLQEFYPQLLAAEQKIINGITIPKVISTTKTNVFR